MVQSVGRRLRIFVVGPRGFPGVQGGIEKFCENFYPRLVGMGYDVTSFSSTRYGSHKEWRGVKFIRIRVPRSRNLERVVYNFLTCAICILRRPDIVHVHSIASGLFIFALKMTGLKVIARYNSRDYLHAKWGFIGRMILKVSEWEFFLADFIVTNNKFYLKYLESRKRRTPIEFIPNGVNMPDREYSVDDFNNWFGNRLHYKKYILYVGRLTEEKNAQTLIQAFLILNRPDMQLAIVGGSNNKDTHEVLLKQQNRDPRIVFMGTRSKEELDVLYAGSALFVMPSLQEGMPNALLEAMSFNCKILVSKIEGHEQFNFDENNYFEPLDKEELAAKIAWHLDSPVQPDFSAILTPHQWSSIMDKWHELHLKIVGLKEQPDVG